MSTIQKYDEIDINQINYSKPERVGQSFFGSISYGPSLKPLFIQTPKVKSLTNIKDIIDRKAPYLEIEVPNNKLDLYDLFLVKVSAPKLFLLHDFINLFKSTLTNVSPLIKIKSCIVY